MHSFRSRITPVIGILIIAIVAYWPISMFICTLKWDMLSVVLPFRYYAGECINNGIFPLWNPYILTGYPVHTDLQLPLWSQEVWIAGLFGGYSIYTLHVLFIIYIFLAGYGMYRLVYYFNQNRGAAFVSGAVFMMSGYFIGHGQAMFAIIGAAFVPWIVYFFLQNMDSPSLLNTLILAVFLFFQVTGGYQTMTIITGYLLAIMLVYYLIRKGGNPSWRIKTFKFLMLLAFIGTGLCLVLIIPVIQVGSYTGRLSEGLAYEQAIVHSFTLPSLLSVMLPFATAKNSELFQTDLSMRNLYFGIVFLIFFLHSLRFSKKGAEVVILLFGLFCLLVSLGPVLPLHKLLYDHVPLINRFRMPAYFSFFALFAFVLSTGIHLPRSIQLTRSRKSAILAFTGSVFLIVFVLIIYAHVHQSAEQTITGLLKQDITAFLNQASFFHHVKLNGCIQLILLGMLFSLLMFYRKRRYFSRLVYGLILFDLFIAVNLNSYYTVFSLNKPREIAEYMNSQPEGFPIPDDTPVIKNSDEYLKNDILWRNMGIYEKKISFDAFTSFLIDPYYFLADSFPGLKRSVLNHPPLYLARELRPYKMLSQEGYMYDDDVIYVHDSVLRKYNQAFKRDLSDAEVYFLSFSPHESKVYFQSDTASILTFLQLDYTGWSVLVDGKPANHFTSDFMYISAVIPAGSHTITYKYENNPVVTAFIFSYSLFFLLLLLIVWVLFKKRSSATALWISFGLLSITVILVCCFLSRKTISQRQLYDYRLLAREMGKMADEEDNDILWVVNLDDTISFNDLLSSGIRDHIIYQRFNNTGDLGGLFDIVRSTEYDKFGYVNVNLYSPEKVIGLIKEQFSCLDYETKTRFGGLMVFSHTDTCNERVPLFSSCNDYTSANPYWPDFEPEDTVYPECSDKMGCEKIDSLQLFSSAFKQPFEVLSGGKDINIVISADVLLKEGAAPLLAFEVRNKKGRAYQWEYLDIRSFTGGEAGWQKAVHVVTETSNISPDDIIVIYFFNKNRDTFFVDNFMIKTFYTRSLP